MTVHSLSHMSDSDVCSICRTGLVSGHCSHCGPAIMQTPAPPLIPSQPLRTKPPSTLPSALLPSGISRWILLEIPLRNFFYKSKTLASPSPVMDTCTNLHFTQSNASFGRLDVANLNKNNSGFPSLSQLIFNALKNWAKLQWLSQVILLCFQILSK